MKYVFLVLFFVTSLHAGVQKFLKSVGPKNGYHGIHNVDYIYLINLDERPEKWQDSCRRLLPHYVNPHRFAAINGWKLSHDILSKLGVTYLAHHPHGLWGVFYDRQGKSRQEVINVVGRNYFAFNMSKGAIGAALSHLSVLQDAYKAGYNTIWVMEDDIEVFENPHVLSELIEKLDKLVGKDKWDILYTDRDSKDKQGRPLACWNFGLRPNFYPKDPQRFRWRKPISSDFRRVGARYGTYSMIIRRSGMRKILQYFEKYKLFLPYDVDCALVPGLRLYTMRRDVVSTQPLAVSDNWTPNYQR